jgi:hypothetical protein
MRITHRHLRDLQAGLVISTEAPETRRLTMDAWIYKFDQHQAKLTKSGGTYINDEQIVRVENFGVFIYNCLPCCTNGVRSNPVIRIEGGLRMKSVISDPEEYLILTGS